MKLHVPHTPWLQRVHPTSDRLPLASNIATKPPAQMALTAGRE